MKNATLSQGVQILQMIDSGALNRETAQAIIEGRIEIGSHAPRFHAEVVYVQPSYADLKKAFGWVNDKYKGVRFKPIDVCSDVSTETRVIEFRLEHPNKEMPTDVILSGLDERGMRPALYEELLAFAAKYPDEQREHSIIALGSVCQVEGILYSPDVRGDDRIRMLSVTILGYPDPLKRQCRFLAVRK